MNSTKWLTTFAAIAFVAGASIGMATKSIADEPPARQRRVMYNFDGDSCMTTRAGSKGPVAITADDVRRLIDEVTYEGSQVDTVLVCVNAQVMYYPSKVGTLRGTLVPPDARAKWPASEKQRFENLARFFAAGVDPYAVMLSQAKRRGREALLSFRMNDDHGNDFLRTQFWQDHRDCRLGKGALDFGREEVREYTLKLIEEAVRRYDCDGIELDFNRFPTYFKNDNTEQRISKMNALVERVRTVLDQVGKERGRRLVLGVRIPSNYGRAVPTYASCRELGCDPVAWANRKWIDFVVVSEFLFDRADLPIRPWKVLLPGIPVYGGIECTTGGKKEQYLSADDYRRIARLRRKDGADGVYLFNFFTTREYGAEAWEPPFEALRDMNDSASLTQATREKPANAACGFTTDVFVSGEGGYHSYRIPSLLVSKKGTLLAFCEGRKSSRSDAGDIDLLLRRSSDKGRTWQATQLVHEEGGVKPVTIGNPCPVVDQQTGTIWLPFCRDNDDVFVTSSSDDGLTWDKPREITADVKKQDWGWYATGPGVGIQLQRGSHKGRLVIPCDHREMVDGKEVMVSHVFFSHDRGQSWKLGGSLDRHTDECQVVELGSGELMMNARNYWGREGGKPERGGKRAIARSNDGGATWSALEFDSTLIEPVCQASIIAIDAAGKPGAQLLVFTNPASTKKREQLTLRISHDEGKSWPFTRTIEAGSAAYSCLTWLGDGCLGLIYERDDYKKLTFVQVDIREAIVGPMRP